MLIKEREKVGIENLKIPKAFVDYSQTINDVYEILEDYNPTKKRTVLIVFDDMIAEKLSPKVTELFLGGRKLNISLVSTSQSYFKVPKNVRLNVTQYSIMKIPNKRELQQINSNHSSDIYFIDFMKLYKEYIKEPYSFLVNDTNISSEIHYDLGRTCYKIIIDEKIKAINNKVEQNKALHNLDR